jgi:hypothetical protein
LSTRIYEIVPLLSTTIQFSHQFMLNKYIVTSSVLVLASKFY